MKTEALPFWVGLGGVLFLLTLASVALWMAPLPHLLGGAAFLVAATAWCAVAARRR